ncbi:hypothetical protein [Streptomyces nigrescens]|uniref:hypothetical protein n=1 Tax=Streptomyces nigrescens TaxID=1920 RepID=UPI003F4D3794
MTRAGHHPPPGGLPRGQPPAPSEVTVAELDQARDIIDVASVQNRYNLRDREHDVDAATTPLIKWWGGGPDRSARGRSDR